MISSRGLVFWLLSLQGISLITLGTSGCNGRLSGNREITSAQREGVNELDGDQAGATSERSWEEQVKDIVNGTTRRIQLSHQKVTSAELQSLDAIPTLRELLLDEGELTDDDLSKFLGKVDLIHLRLRKSPLTDRSLSLIAETQSHLRILNLPHGTFTERGIAELSRLRELTNLRIGGTSIDDSAVEKIATIPNLESLHLIGPRISDRALGYLEKMSTLSTFYLDDCKLSDDAWLKLFSARPKIHVHIDQLHHDRDPHAH